MTTVQFYCDLADACAEGRSGDVHQVLALIENPINPGFLEGIKYACMFAHKNGHLDLAQTINKHIEFYDAFQKRNSEMIFSMSTMYPFLYKICTCFKPHEYDNIKQTSTVMRMRTEDDIEILGHVRIAEHIRWQTRKYAVWMRTAKCGVENVFCTLSEDVSRYIVQLFL